MNLKLLKNQEDFDTWKHKNIYPGDIAEQPKNFPCYARTIVESWNLEEERAIYLYREDIDQMQKEMYG